MRYTLLLHHAEATPEAVGAESWKAAEAAFASYLRSLDEAGVLVAAEVLQPVALEEAVRRWPEAGVPTKPEGWLLTVARNRQRDVFRSAAHRTTFPLDDGSGVVAGTVMGELNPGAIPDKRLELLFVCAHPAIAPTLIRTPPHSTNGRQLHIPP
jgi:RNA polymerase sigma-70 factor, ECF subfamily